MAPIVVFHGSAFSAMVTRTLTVLAALIASALVASGHPGPQAGEEPRARVRIHGSNLTTLQAQLASAGYDVIGAAADQQAVELAVTPSEWQALAGEGYEVAFVDRSRPLGSALAPEQPSSAPASAAMLASADVVPASYRTLDGIVTRMQEIATAYPAIAQVVDITAAYGTPPTAEGRHLFALKISDNVAADEDEPSMLIVSAHHAREISTPVITLGAAERLTSGYATDARIAAAVNGNEIWIAPVWNPDGYNHVFTADNLWRKNRRVFGNGVGVDQNRNYPQGWNGSCAGSTSVGSETYKGPAAASEAETQTLMTWSMRERFAKVIDYHSYGREVLYGYLCLNHPFTSWMQQEAAALSRASGYDGATRLPSADGEHPQWQFARMGAYAFLIETHTQFQPSYTSALTEAALVWPGVLSVLDRPISVSGHVIDVWTGAPIAATIDLPNIAFSNGEGNASGGSYGAYHVFLPPGTYDIRFTAPGYSPQTRQVVVTSTSAEVLNVTLSPLTPPAPANLRIVR
jgi:hypothetical protein